MSTVSPSATNLHSLFRSGRVLKGTSVQFISSDFIHQMSVMYLWNVVGCFTYKC